jgi:hypothetical protein
MDANELAALEQLNEATNEAMESSDDLVASLREQIEGYKKLYDQSLDGAQDLATAMDKQLQGRTSRRRLSIVVGAVALIIGLLALWNSSSVGTGFHQTLLVTAGGALLTFCLVELILDKIIEIPSREARNLQKAVGIYKLLNEELVDRGKDLLERMNRNDSEIDKILEKRKKIAFPDNP